MSTFDSFDIRSLEGSAGNFATSHSLAIASYLAYESDTSIKDWCQSWGFNDTVFFDKDNTQGFVTWSNSTMLLSYRGTEKNFSDWLRNLRISSVRQEWGRVHRGFNKGLLVAWDEVRQAFIDGSHNTKSHIWVTGHSLGGALATLAATALQPSVKVTGIDTFGQPRTANSRFGSNFDQVFADRFFRYVNNRDIVTRIPPGYDHFGALRKFDKHGHLENPSGFESLGEHLEEPALSIEQFSALQGDMEENLEGIIPGADDHAITEYISHLSKLI